MSNPVEWKDLHSIYPPFKEIVEALQDPGVKAGSTNKLSKETGTSRKKFLKLAKISTVLYKKLKDAHNPQAQLGENVSRGKDVLLMEMLQSRRHVDTHEADVSFHAFGKEGKVYLIHNCPKCAGLDLAIQRFQQAHEHHIKSRAANRTPEDGLRLAGVLFHSEHRSAVAGIMTNRKDRKKSDVPGDTTRNFFVEALDYFLDPTFEVGPPREEHWSSEHIDEDRDRWDPNNPVAFENPRSADWLMETWFTCIKPKCKNALDKWNKDTGGGDGTPASFFDFCGNDKWLAWIFLHDFDANFLLANNASGRIPNHLQLEAGFDANMSNIAEDDEKTNSSKKIRDFEKQLKEIKEDKSDFNNLTSLLNDCFRSKMSSETAKKKEPEDNDCENSEEGDSNTPRKMSHDFCLMRANCCRKQMLDLAEDETLDEDIKAQHTEMLKARRKRYLMAAIEKESNKRNKTS